MIKSIDIETLDARTFNAEDRHTISGAVVHGEVEASGITFTYSAQLTSLELEGLNGVLLSADRRMRKALGLETAQSNGTGSGR